MGIRGFCCFLGVLALTLGSAHARVEVTVDALASLPKGAEYLGYVRLEDGQSWYIDYLAAKPGMPTVAFFNGMTWSTEDWTELVGELQKIKPGIGILRFDMEGMGRTLKKVGSIDRSVDYKRNVANSIELIRALNLDIPAHYVSLSYGGAIAMEAAVEAPELYKSLILMAPYMAPLVEQDAVVRAGVKMARSPMFRAWYAHLSDDELYERYLRNFVYFNYPSAETSLMAPFFDYRNYVIPNPFNLEVWERTHPLNLEIEAAFRKAQGARTFRAARLTHRFKDRSVFFLDPQDDEYIDRFDYNVFWEHDIPSEKHASRLKMTGVKHKIPQSGRAGGAPRVAAQFLEKILDGKPELFLGRTFYSDRESLVQDSLCEVSVTANGG